VPDEVQPRNLDDGLFQPSADDILVTLELDPAAYWVVEYYQCETVEELPDSDRLRVGLRTPDTRWVARLVLRLGGAARIVAPVELADRVRDQARAALAQYGD
jgi:proteasome accessory factor C